MGLNLRSSQTYEGIVLEHLCSEYKDGFDGLGKLGTPLRLKVDEENSSLCARSVEKDEVSLYSIAALILKHKGKTSLVLQVGGWAVGQSPTPLKQSRLQKP